jgi:carbamoyl-phosphate synthase large subunit
MKSTGEVLGIDHSYGAAVLKAMIGAGVRVPENGTALVTVNDKDKPIAVEIAKQLTDLGYNIMATGGTYDALVANGIAAFRIEKISESKDLNLLTEVRDGNVQLLINTPSENRETEKEAMLIRRACVEKGIPCITSIDTASALLLALQVRQDKSHVHCQTVDDYATTARQMALRGALSAAP